MGYRQLSGICLSEKNEYTFRIRVVHPVINVVQEVSVHSWKTVPFDVGVPASLVRDFSDFSIKVCVLVVRLTILRQSKTTYQYLRLGPTHSPVGWLSHQAE